jgi:hypothetical protein
LKNSIPPFDDCVGLLMDKFIQALQADFDAFLRPSLEGDNVIDGGSGTPLRFAHRTGRPSGMDPLGHQSIIDPGFPDGQEVPRYFFIWCQLQIRGLARSNGPTTSLRGIGQGGLLMLTSGY